MPPDESDPMWGPTQTVPLFCRDQTASLKASVDALTSEVRRMTIATEHLRESMHDDMERATIAALHSLTKNSDFGRPWWESGADHMGRRWYDSWSRWLGNAATKFLLGIIIAAAGAWYVFFGGGAK